jgi:hypothetical protein
MPGGTVYKRDIQLTKNIAPPCRGKTPRTSHDNMYISRYFTKQYKYSGLIQVQWTGYKYSEQ